MSQKIAPVSVLAVALVLSLAACSKEETTVVEPAPTVAVPEMKPTGDLASSYGTAPVGETPAAPTGSAVPEMTPTGTMKQAVVPSDPTKPAPPPPTPIK